MVKAVCIQTCFADQLYVADKEYVLPEDFSMARHFKAIEGEFSRGKVVKASQAEPAEPKKKK